MSSAAQQRVGLGTSKLTQGPSALKVPVEVEKWSGPAPKVRAHETAFAA